MKLGDTSMETIIKVGEEKLMEGNMIDSNNNKNMSHRERGRETRNESPSSRVD